MTSFLLLALAGLIGLSLGQEPIYQYVHCELLPNRNDPNPEGQSISGQIEFRQTRYNAGVDVTMNISGFDTRDSATEHGVHIHDYGDYSNPCDESHGGHYNPFGAYHGDRSDPITNRHVGDLGNIQEDRDGNVVLNFFLEDFPDFTGQYSIVGRSLIIKRDRDDLGLFGNENSLRTGSGSQVGRTCCILGRATGGSAFFTAP